MLFVFMLDILFSKYELEEAIKSTLRNFNDGYASLGYVHDFSSKLNASKLTHINDIELNSVNKKLVEENDKISNFIDNFAHKFNKTFRNPELIEQLDYGKLYDYLNLFAQDYPFELDKKLNENLELIERVKLINMFANSYISYFNRITNNQTWFDLDADLSDLTKIYSGKFDEKVNDPNLNEAEKFKLSPTSIYNRISFIHVKDDYINNVFRILLDNTYEHGFSNLNDAELKNITINKGYKYFPYIKQIDIEAEFDEPNQMYNIIYNDFGKGISLDLIDKIGEFGVSTKINTSTQHGVGIYGAKKFVEEKGGTFEVVKKPLYHGTEFKFSISAEINSQGGLVQKILKAKF